VTMPALSPFSTNIPNFQTSWDSTSLGWFKDCPRLYYYQMIERWQPKSKGIHLAFGGWYASGVERYAHHIASGLDHEEAVMRVVEWALKVTGERDEEGKWIAWESGDDFKNRYTLVRSLVWNMDDRLDSHWNTVILANGKPAVELSFNFHAFDLDGEAISLSGHMDELVENNGQVWVKDDKTSKGQLDARYFQQYTPHNQMSLYSIAGKIIYGDKISGVLVRGAQIGVGFTRFATGQVPRTEAVLNEWLEDTKHYVRSARDMAINNYWPMNDKSCDKFNGCPFRRVCAVSPNHRKSWLEADFVKREWNPLVARGDI
jgi:hypothetical protein